MPAETIAQPDEKTIIRGPEFGHGVLPPLFSGERIFDRLADLLLLFAIIPFLAVAILVSIDVVGRLFFNLPIIGMTDIERLLMSVCGFAAMPFVATVREAIQVDMLYERFSATGQRFCYLFSMILCACISFLISWCAWAATEDWATDSEILGLSEVPFVIWTSISLALVGLAFILQIIQVFRIMWKHEEKTVLLLSLFFATLVLSIPALYIAAGIKISNLTLGGLGFLLLMVLLFMRMPLGFAMMLIGILGLMCVTRNPEAALSPVGTVPFTETTTFTMIAFPLFMLMGDVVSLSGLSTDLFDAAKKWLGRLPGGLAVATVAGCAGFGAVCGESLATVLTMSAVAMPAMSDSKYDTSLSAGTLAAGGTLGILIPPSMGFIIFSMITEAPIGKLFMAGIMPGILLSSIFIGIIMFQVKRKPELAPRLPAYPLTQKLLALLGLIPIILLFLMVIIGINNGWYTPAEGGALGSTAGFIYAIVRRKLNRKVFMSTMRRSTAMFGKVFAMFIGLKILSAFLGISRLPLLLSDLVCSLDVSRDLILLAVIILYIFLGCVMNIMPMMMLTLPTIFPVIVSLGFDPIWFGVMCVVTMEMGQITPPVGINVFTLSSIYPDIPVAKIFKGVLPFFIGMLLCIFILWLFPQIPLCLV
ncbi:MAG: TRAP transporter large permease subunit [Mailhella sp.]|nr:TRAP transporter large permease subunit [Mailhella sp.]